MSFRARLSVFALEQRENPSVSVLDPIGGIAPPLTEPVPPPPPTTPVVVAPTTPTDPLLGTNPIYQIPLVP
ncbi:unnamed protein product [Gemmata massiliana]|uniref:Uncharacterized protein n=1 Tax=Gemmata massiliana TaxID=1210884 RepID=A0A6P2CWK3_9BACT|nr:hypothetical protein [Gemmata massiliana]VTR92977.1 unnamed protein product [Gemmata massiliana]